MARSRRRNKRLKQQPQQQEQRDVALNVNKLRQYVNGMPVLSGVQISEDNALGLTGVWRAVDLLSTTLATLTLRVFQLQPDGGKSAADDHPIARLLRHPSKDYNPLRVFRSWYLQAVCTGNGYLEIERDLDADPIALHLLHWRNVEPKRTPNGVIYHLKEEGVDLPSKNILHISTNSWDGLCGISPIKIARESLGITKAAEQFSATFFGNGAQPRGVLSTPQKLDEAAATRLREDWSNLHGGPENANKVAVLEQGLAWTQTSFNAEDAALLATRNFQINEISRIFSVPPNLLFEDKGSYNSNEESNLQFYQLGLRPWLEVIEAELDFKLLADQSYFTEHDIDSLLRGNLQTRADVVTKLFTVGAIDINETRAEFGYNPRTEGVALYVPANQTRIDPDGYQLPVGYRPEDQHQGEEPPEHGQPVDPAPVAETAPEGQPAPDVQATAMNGAQIASLLTVVQAVGAGQLPASSAKAMLQASFPTLSPDLIAGIVDPAVGTIPKEPEKPPGSPLPPPEDLVATALRETLGRLVRREITNLRKHDGDHEWLLGFLPKHRAFLVSTLTPYLGERTEDFADRWVGQSREALSAGSWQEVIEDWRVNRTDALLMEVASG